MYKFIFRSKSRRYRDYSRLQEYYCEEKKISLRDVLDTNKATISVMAFYCSKEGEEEVKKFLQANCKEYLDQNYFESMFTIPEKPKDNFDENVKEIYDIDFSNNKYAVIREFNLTKVNVFPNETMFPQNISSLFIIKKEDEFMQE